jgi:hypothetical protein
MAYSSKTYPGDGSTVDFAVTFAYLDQSHVRVSVDKVPTTAVGSPYKFTWNNPTSIRVDTVIDGLAVPSDLDIKLYRETPIAEPAVVFGGGASLTSANLNKNSEYLTYALQEATDTNEEFTKLYLGSFAQAPTTDNEGDALQLGAVYYDSVLSALYYWTGSEWIIGESTSAAQTFMLAAQQAVIDAGLEVDAAVTAREGAETAQGIAQGAATSSGASATTSGDSASLSAGYRDQAAAYAASIDPATLVTKSANLSDLTDAELALTNLGLSLVGRSFTALTTTLGQQQALSLEPGVNVQVYNANLTAALAAYTLPTTVGTSDGQVLTTDAGGATSWEDPPETTSPGMELITRTVLSGSPTTVDFTGFDNTVYDHYIIMLSNVTPTGDNVQLRLRLSDDGGATYEADASDYRTSINSFTGDAYDNLSESYHPLASHVGGASTENGVCGSVWIHGASLGNRTFTTFLLGSQDLAGRPKEFQGSGRTNGTAENDAVQFFFSSGNLESGVISLYGMRNA